MRLVASTAIGRRATQQRGPATKRQVCLQSSWDVLHRSAIFATHLIPRISQVPCRLYYPSWLPLTWMAPCGGQKCTCSAVHHSSRTARGVSLTDDRSRWSLWAIHTAFCMSLQLILGGATPPSHVRHTLSTNVLCCIGVWLLYPVCPSPHVTIPMQWPPHRCVTH